MNTLDKDEIIVASKVHPARVSNIYLYGSRVYGTNDIDSDYDILLIGSSLLESQELYIATPAHKYNIHIHVPSRFEDDLRKHDIHALECIWAPEYAQIQVKRDYASEFKLDRMLMKKRLFGQSHDSWVKACHKIKETDMYRGAKGIYHSLRILMFGIQIAKHGKIVDFTEGNSLYNEIMSADEYTWDYYKNKYLPIKKDLENKLREA